MPPLKDFIDSLGSLTLCSGALAGVISRVGVGVVVGGAGSVVNFRALSILTNAACMSLL